MNKITNPEEMGAVDRLLVSIGRSPWDELYRAAIGFALIPAMSRLSVDRDSGWMLVPSLLIILLMLRVVPALIRKLLPFSNTVLVIWFKRRQIAKRYDSYQWQKLFWLGIGIGLYTVVSGRSLLPRIVVSLVCLLSGALGLVRWRTVASRTDGTVKQGAHTPIRSGAQSQ